MVGLAGVLMRGGDPEGAEALYRKAVEAGDADWSAHASSLLGDVLEGKGDVAGATAAWLLLILTNPDKSSLIVQHLIGWLFMAA